MSIKQENLPMNKNDKAGKILRLRKPYQKPYLKILGDLRTLTLGLSPTKYKDSGGGLYTETFPTLPPP